jgi:hypothetical protein
LIVQGPESGPRETRRSRGLGHRQFRSVDSAALGSARAPICRWRCHCSLRKCWTDHNKRRAEQAVRQWHRASTDDNRASLARRRGRAAALAGRRRCCCQSNTAALGRPTGGWRHRLAASDKPMACGRRRRHSLNGRSVLLSALSFGVRICEFQLLADDEDKPDEEQRREPPGWTGSRERRDGILSLGGGGCDSHVMATAMQQILLAHRPTSGYVYLSAGQSAAPRARLTMASHEFGRRRQTTITHY